MDAYRWTAGLVSLAGIIVGLGCSGSGDDKGDASVVSYGGVVFSSITPASGSARGGDRVTIIGRGFSKDVEVFFGDLAATSLEVVSDSEVTVRTPKQLAGHVDVTVNLKSGTGSAKAYRAFEYKRLSLQFRTAPQWSLPALDSVPTQALTLDFNNDGFADILLARDSHPAVLWLNGATGTFTDPDDSTSTPQGDASVEADGDALIDAGSDVTSTIGEREPTTSAVRTWEFASGKMIGDDLNGDGVADVLLCNRSGQQNQVMLNDGRGRFTAARDAFPATSDECIDAVWGDFDADGHKELAVLGRGPAGSGHDYVRVYKRAVEAGEPKFAVVEELEPKAALGSTCVIVKTITEQLTISATTAEDPDNKDNTVCAIQQTAKEGTTFMVAAHMHLPATSAIPEKIEFRVRTKSSTGTKATSRLQLVDNEDEVFQVSIGTVKNQWKKFEISNLDKFTVKEEQNKNGTIDLPIKRAVLVFDSTVKDEVIWLDDVRMTVKSVGSVLVDDFERKDFVLQWPVKMSFLEAGDLDGDNKIDLFIASNKQEPGDRAAWARNTSEGSLGFVIKSSAVLSSLPDAIGGVQLLDGDRDDHLDIVLVTADQDRYLRNDGTGQFFDDTFAYLSVDRSAGSSVFAADMDLDGLQDLVIANTNSVDRLYVGHKVTNAEERHFQDMTPSMPLRANETRSLVPFDADGDGDLDLLLLTVDDPKCSLLISSDVSQ